MIEEDKNLLVSNEKKITFNDEPLVREYMKCTDSKRFIQKKAKKVRKSSQHEAEEEKIQEEVENQKYVTTERIYKELTVKSSLKQSAKRFTYTFPIMN